MELILQAQFEPDLKDLEDYLHAALPEKVADYIFGLVVGPRKMGRPKRLSVRELRRRNLSRRWVTYEAEERTSKGETDARRAVLEEAAPKLGLNYRQLERRLGALNPLYREASTQSDEATKS
jgi:hypothetical protein